MPARLVAALPAVLAVFLPLAASAQTVQDTILSVKPAVVLVTATVEADVVVSCGAGATTVRPAPVQEQGTGWLIDGRGFVVTTADVVDPAHTQPPGVTHELKKRGVDQACVAPALARQGLGRGERPDLEDRLRAAIDLDTVQVNLKASVTVMLSSGATQLAEVAKFAAPVRVDGTGKPLSRSGRDLALLRIKDGNYPALRLADGSMRIGDAVHVIGFPGVVLSHELLRRGTTLEASVTNGALSGVSKDALGQEVLRTDASAAHGTSGSPAISDNGAVVGVVAFISMSADDRNQVQGFNVLIPGQAVAKFLEGTDVRPGESRFNVLWTAGLASLAGQRYDKALEAFRAADALVPGQPDVRRAMAEAEAKVKNPPPRPLPWGWIAIGVVVVAGGGYGALAYRKWQRNRFRINAKEVAKMMEEGESPVLLDVRQPSTVTRTALRIPGARYVDPTALEKGAPGLKVDPDRTVVAYCT